MMLRINDDITIGDQFLTIRFVRSRGPGGQNVNKLNTCAQLIFDLKNCPSLSHTVKRRLKLIARSRINNTGQLIITADNHRTQFQNRRATLDRLADLIRRALIVPPKRIPTRPSAAARKRRLEFKKHRSILKSQRKPPNLND